MIHFKQNQWCVIFVITVLAVFLFLTNILLEWSQSKIWENYDCIYKNYKKKKIIQTTSKAQIFYDDIIQIKNNCYLT